MNNSRWKLRAIFEPRSLLPLLLILPLAAGCAKKAPVDAGLVVAAFHGGEPAGAWERANLDRFTAAQDGLTSRIELHEIYANPVAMALTDQVTAEPPPDVIVAPIAGAMRDLVAEGTIADLSDLWAAEGWDESYPATLRTLVSVDGRPYFVPQAVQWNPIWYRTDLFAELGLTPPNTWERFLETCEKLHEAGYIAVTASTEWSPPVARWFTILNLRLNGPDFHEALMRGRQPWNGPRVRAVFARWAELFERHCFAPSSSENTYMKASQELVDGRAVMWNIGEWLFEFTPEGMEEKLDFFAFPTLDPSLPRGEIAHVYGAFTPTKAPHPEAARAYLAYLGDKGSQASNVEALGRLVGRLDVEHSESLYQQGFDFIRDADVLVPLLEFSTHRDMANAALEGFVRFWRDRSTVDAVLEDLEAQRQKSYGP